MALKIPRAKFIATLKSAPGSISQHWLNVMEDYERDEISHVTGTKRRVNDIEGRARISLSDDSTDDHAFPNLDAIEHPLAAVNILQMTCYTSNHEEATGALKTLARLCKLKENLTYFGSRGMLEGVTYMIDDNHFPHSASVSRYALECIAELAIDDSTQENLGELFVCSSIVRMLQLYGTNDASVAEWGCNAIQAMTQANSDTKHDFEAEPEICDILMTLLQTHVPVGSGVHAGVALMIGFAIANLAQVLHGKFIELETPTKLKAHIIDNPMVSADEKAKQIANLLFSRSRVLLKRPADKLAA